jgi:hypothetical protein
MLAEIFKDITIKEYSRAGIGAVAIILIVWYLYGRVEKQNELIARHQFNLEKRVERLETNYEDCLTSKFEAMREQVDKSNNWLQRTDKHLSEIENLIIKNK